ncbi:MAG: ATP-binding protein [Acidobacteriaceae bacterium]|nr:ATP-binding protein [Acidobacteriaceae bacterium]
MRLIHSLYAKIFSWFWLTLGVGALLVLIVTLFTGTQPLGRRWARLTQDMYAHSAIDFYQSGGTPALQRYVDILQKSSGIQAALLDEHQQNVLPRPTPPNVQSVLADSLRRQRSAVHLGRVWTSATPLLYGSRRFLFVMEVHPLDGFVDGTFARPFLNRLLLAFLVASLFCLLLTRHIVAPVKALQLGAQRLAAGDLRTRVAPEVTARNDELADTARAFDQMADRMQLLIQGRQELLADISHELRSPLTRISVCAELIQRGELDVVERIQVDVKRMNAMIGQILLLTRLDLQPPAVVSDAIDLPGMLESITQDAALEAQHLDKSIHLHVGSSCIIHGEANLIRSAIENVVRNAVRYTEPGTTVEVAAQRLFLHEQTLCEVIITDSGTGVPEDALQKLFDPFFRVSEAREHDSEGTGLGLSISRRIVEMHNGTIYARNRSDRPGLQVCLQLPTK